MYNYFFKNGSGYDATVTFIDNVDLFVARDGQEHVVDDIHVLVRVER